MKTRQDTPPERVLDDLNRRLDNLEKKLEEASRPVPGWYDAEEVCRRFGITKRTLDKYRHSGKIPFSKMGGRVYFRGADFEALLEKNLDLKTKKS